MHLDLLTRCTKGHVTISLRRRWPVSFHSEAQAVTQGIALLHQHAEVVGFILVPADLQAAKTVKDTCTKGMAAVLSAKKDAEECFQDMKDNAEDIIVDANAEAKKEIYVKDK